MWRSAVIVWGLLDRSTRIRSVFLVGQILFTGLLEAAGIGMVLPLFQVISNPASLETDRWLSMANRILGHPGHARFIQIFCAILLAFFIIKNLLMVFDTYSRARFIWRGSTRLQARLLAIYLYRPFARQQQENSALAVRNVTTAIGQCFIGMVMPGLMLLSELAVAAAVGGVLFIAQPLAATIVIVVLSVPMLAIMPALRRPLSRWGQRVHECNAEILTILHHCFGGLKEIKVLGRERAFLGTFRRVTQGFALIQERRMLVESLPRLLLEVLVIVSLMAMAVAIVGDGQSAIDAVPVLGLFGAAAIRLMPSLTRISGLVSSMKFNEAALMEVARDMKEEPEAQAAARGIAEAAGSAPLRHSLELRNITCIYPGAERPSLQDVSLTIRRGESVAFIGSTGAGKTTLANLVLGLLEPNSGSVLVDGTEVSHRRNWVGHVGLVPQDVFLLDDSLRRNIALGLPDDLIDEVDLARAVSSAQLEELIASLPSGLDTMVGERGTRLSGGQRQRVAIARALYGDPDLLVLDEATSALDAETEATITGAITRLHGIKTLILIAHRLSTVRHCDRLYWMKDGRIADSGTFEELAQRNAEFQTMLRHLDLSETLALARNGD